MEVQPTLYVADRPAWRRWLTEHHATTSAIWLISYKAETMKPSVSYLHARERLPTSSFWPGATTMQ